MNTNREILIANRHPRLRLDRRAVVKMIHTLDAQFPLAIGQAAWTSSKSKAGNPSLKTKLSPSPQDSGVRHSVPDAPAGELSIVFLTDAALAQLHADFLDDPTPTDVITFAGDPAQGTAGEICVSVDAALRHVSPSKLLRSSSASRLSTLDFSTELTLYLVHGWLHLGGFDDLQPTKKRQMRRAEARAMKLLRAAKALPRFSQIR